MLTFLCKLPNKHVLCVQVLCVVIETSNILDHRLSTLESTLDSMNKSSNRTLASGASGMAWSSIMGSMVKGLESGVFDDRDHVFVLL